MPRITPTVSLPLIPDHSPHSQRGRLEACPLTSERLRLRGIRTDTPSAQLHTRAACVAGPCLAHIALGVAAPHSVCHRARLRLFLLCLPCLFVQWRAPVPPAVAHLCHQLAHAMCRGWPTSRPHLPRRRLSSALSSAPTASKPAELLTRFRRARRSARRPSPRSQQSSSRDLTRSQRAMSRAAGSRAAAWLRCQR